MIEKDLGKRLQDIEDLLEENIRQSADIYSIKSQKPLEEYSGSLKDYFKESKLRKKVTTGRKSFFGNIAAAVTGNAEFSEFISAAFDAKYSKEEIEDAKKQLEEEFGVKQKVEEPKEKYVSKEQIQEILKEYFDPINSSVSELIRVAEKTGSDAQRTQSEVKTISKGLIGIIENITNATLGRKTKFNENDYNLKPETITDMEGKEYLYYPGAPEGRQFYEKSKTGTAGKIVSKEIQRELKKSIGAMASEIKPVRKKDLKIAVDETTGEIYDDIKNLLNESSAVRKTEMQELFQKLYEQLSAKQTSVQNLEEDEIANILKKSTKESLKEALKEYFTENPILNNDGILSMFGPGGFKGLFRQLGRLLLRLRAFTALGAIATVGTIGIGELLENEKETTESRTDKVLLDTLQKSSPAELAALIDSDVENKQLRAYRLQEFRKIVEQNPSLKNKLMQAEEIAGTTGISPMDIQNGKFLKPTAAELRANTREPIAARKIIEENQKREEIKNNQSDMQSQQQNQQPVNQVVNQIVQQSGDKKISVHNNENTYNRLVAQDFDHPYTYSTGNMG